MTHAPVTGHAFALHWIPASAGMTVMKPLQSASSRRLQTPQLAAEGCLVQLFDLEIRGAGDFRPALHVLAQERGELIRTAGERFGAARDELFAQFLFSEAFHDSLVESGDHLARRPGGRQNAVPIWMPVCTGMTEEHRGHDNLTRS